MSTTQDLEQDLTPEVIRRCDIELCRTEDFEDSSGQPLLACCDRPSHDYVEIAFAETKDEVIVEAVCLRCFIHEILAGEKVIVGNGE